MGITPDEMSILVPKPRPRRPIGRWLKYAAAALASVIVLGAGSGYAYVRRSLPAVSGTLTMGGLQKPVTVYRDEQGVPHIVAQNRHDLYMAQGFVTAQDRMWQMDVSRRAAAGRLAEIFGESYVSTDKFLRSLMMRKAAEASLDAYSPWARAELEAYVAGVNAYLQQASAGGKLPVEFTLLGYKPEPWSTADTLSIGKFMAYDLGGNWEGEVYRYQLRQKVGDELAKQLWPVYPGDGITILASSAEPQTERRTVALPPETGRIDVSGLLAAAPVRDQFVGSNNWVVSGKLTRSGRPMLANDPHLSVRTPAIWYQTHLVVKGEQEKLDVIGVIFPGAPGLVIGHNDKVAWGVTNTNPDVQDLYIERRNPANPYQFEYQGKWEDAKVYQEPIRVKGQPDVPFELVVTRHGPIISEVAGSKDNRPQEALALKWTAHMPTPEMEAVLAFGKAGNWPEFREALRQFRVPTQNFVFAAVDGTIAYHAAGLVPIRAKGDGLVPVPGWTGEYEWQEFIPFDKMPEVVNPPAGFVVTANNKVVGNDYPYLLTHSWAQPYRAARITEVLRGKLTGITVDEMRRLQADDANLQARSLAPLLVPMLEKATLNQTETAALQLLKQWDFVDGAEQGAPLVFHTWWKHVTRMLYVPKMGEDLFKNMADQGNVTDEILRKAAAGQENDWVKAAGGYERLVLESFKGAVAEAAKLQGADTAQWSWGAFHRLGPVHPVGGAVKALGALLNAKPQPVGGSNVTVRAMSFNRETGMVTSGGVWRQVVDLADVAGNSYDVLTPGQAGHFLSPWYDDQASMHVRGELHPQRMNEASYSKGKKLVLQP